MSDDLVKEAQLAMWSSYCDMKMELENARDRIKELEGEVERLTKVISSDAEADLGLSYGDAK